MVSPPFLDLVLCCQADVRFRRDVELGLLTWVGTGWENGPLKAHEPEHKVAEPVLKE